jgi:protein TonB
MTEHLSAREISRYLIEDAGPAAREHVSRCTACRAEVSLVERSLAAFRGAIRRWSEQAEAESLLWTVDFEAAPIPAEANDPVAHLLLPAALDTPWYRGLVANLRDWIRPAPLPPLRVTSRPVPVGEIWGLYRRQKKSWMLSLALQSAVVLLLFTAFASHHVQEKVAQFIPLISPDIVPTQPKTEVRQSGGGGGGDRSPLQPSKGRVPKPAPKQFSPPVAAAHNVDPKLTMEPALIAPPDVQLPKVASSAYGDPLAQLGVASNGPGAAGGIGSGTGGGIGPGKGPGFGPGAAGGIGGGVYRAGGGVSAPVLLYKVEPEYSEEARKAKVQGAVVLYVEVDPAGRARDVRVVRSLGLGLDEKAIEAVSKWKFRPGYKNGRPVTVVATIEVNFRLL